MEKLELGHQIAGTEPVLAKKELKVVKKPRVTKKTGAKRESIKKSESSLKFLGPSYSLASSESFEASESLTFDSSSFDDSASNPFPQYSVKQYTQLMMSEQSFELYEAMFKRYLEFLAINPCYKVSSI